MGSGKNYAEDIKNADLNAKLESLNENESSTARSMGIQSKTTISTN